MNVSHWRGTVNKGFPQPGALIVIRKTQWLASWLYNRRKEAVPNPVDGGETFLNRAWIRDSWKVERREECGSARAIIKPGYVLCTLSRGGVEIPREMCVCTDPYNRYCQPERHFIYGELKPRFPGIEPRFDRFHHCEAGTMQLSAPPLNAI